MRVLIDSVYISTGGGLVLFNYLISKLQGLPVEIFYLIDERNSTKYPEIVLANMAVIKPGYWKRHLFYLRHKDSFDVVFTFNNLPPSVKLQNAEVYTYFHQNLYLKTAKIELTIKNRLLFVIKKVIFRSTIENTNIFCVQTERVKNELHRKYDVRREAIRVLPFFEEVAEIIPTEYLKDDFGFIYISDGQEHKNHERLLKAWNNINTVYPQAKLTLTVSNNRFPRLCKEIEKWQKKGVNVNNVDFLGQAEMYKLYRDNKFLIYPSLAESFGLGLIEAAQFKCEIIAADLDYVKEVVIPSAVFDPLDFNSIANVVIECLHRNDRPERTRRIVENKIDDLVKCITQSG